MPLRWNRILSFHGDRGNNGSLCMLPLLDQTKDPAKNDQDAFCFGFCGTMSHITMDVWDSCAPLGIPGETFL